MPASTPPLRLRCLNDWSQVQSTWPRWQSAGVCTAFQTMAWMRPLYRHLAPALGAEPLFLEVTHAETGAPLMLWPLWRRRRLGLPVLSFADAGVSDYNAPLLAAPELPADAWRQALAALRPHGTLLHLEKLPSGAGLGPALGARARAASFGTWAVDLPGSLQAYQAQTLPAAFAKDLAMRQRRLLRKGPLRFERAETPAARRAAFDTLLRQRARRCAETARDDILARPAFRRFYEAAAVDEPDDTVRLFTLTVGDTTVASMLAIDHGGTRHMVMPSFEAGEWKNGSPGNVLILLAIGDAIDSGLGRFDFTIGDEAYKAGFGAVRRPLLGAWLPLSLAGSCAVQGVGLARGLRRRLAAFT